MTHNRCSSNSNALILAMLDHLRLAIAELNAALVVGLRLLTAKIEEGPEE